MNTIDTAKSLAPWFHNVTLPCGYDTKPDQLNNPDDIWKAISPWYKLFQNKTLLDIGCNGGELTRRFEQLYQCKVEAIDKNPLYVKQTKFVIDTFNLQATAKEADLLQDSFINTYEIVALFGVIYHHENPIDTLRKALKLCTDYLILETAHCTSTISLFEYRNWTGEYLNEMIPSIPAIYKMITNTGATVLDKNIYCPTRSAWLLKPPTVHQTSSPHTTRNHGQ